MCDTMFGVPIEQKSNDKAHEARVTGNDRYQGKDFLYALNHYNRSIACAKSKNVAALAYGNRSAVYFEAKLYDDCLENIQLARENGYPANKLSKLIKREAKCKEIMQQMNDEEVEPLWNFFKLSYAANEKIPWVVNCVEMRKTEKYGRGIYAKQDLKAGDIICVEESFFNCTCFNKYDTENHYFHCYNCFKSNRMNLIPCDRIASIMFCSIACKEDFYSKAVDMNSILSADVKLLSDVAGFFGSVKSFDDYIKRTDLKTLNKTIFDYDLSDPDDPEYRNKLVNCFLSLSTNKHRAGEHRCVESYVSDKASHHLLSIFFLNQKELNLRDGCGTYFETGHHVSLFASLINHACYNNACSLNVGSKIVTYLVKPVKAGEQIFYRYGGTLLAMGFMKEQLEAKHMFKCDCEACTQSDEMARKDFESGSGMKDNKTIYLPNPAYERDYEKAREELKKYFDDMNENPELHKILSVPLMRSEDILKVIAYQCCYPFPKYEKY